MNRPSMIRLALAVGLALAVPGWAGAACYADYKARRGNPLELHYGVARLPDPACADRRRAERLLRERLAREGWTLLRLISTFGEEGLANRRDRAGRYFLRF